MNPNDLPGGWSGCAYARYLGDAYNNNDADTVRGQVTVGTGAGQRQWMGWEPMARDDSEPRSGRWGDNSANNNGPGSSSRWIASTTWREKNCNNAYFLDISTTAYDQASGAITDDAGTLQRQQQQPPRGRAESVGSHRLQLHRVDVEQRFGDQEVFGLHEVHRPDEILC